MSTKLQTLYAPYNLIAITLIVSIIIAYLISPVKKGATNQEILIFLVTWIIAGLVLVILILFFLKKVMGIKKEDFEKAHNDFMKDVKIFKFAYAPNIYFPFSSRFDVLAYFKVSTNDLEKFHIAQAFVLKTFEAAFIIILMLFIGIVASIKLVMLLYSFYGLIIFIILIFILNSYCVYKARRGIYVKIPLISNIARKIMNNPSLVGFFMIAPIILFLVVLTILLGLFWLMFKIF